MYVFIYVCMGVCTCVKANTIYFQMEVFNGIRFDLTQKQNMLAAKCARIRQLQVRYPYMYCMYTVDIYLSNVYTVFVYMYTGMYVCMNADVITDNECMCFYRRSWRV
jgi:hypothetical protein